MKIRPQLFVISDCLENPIVLRGVLGIYRPTEIIRVAVIILHLPVDLANKVCLLVGENGSFQFGLSVVLVIRTPSLVKRNRRSGLEGG